MVTFCNTYCFRVFPAEACETIGGEACLADTYPEVKLQPEARINSALNTAPESVDREYLDYDGPKTYDLSLNFQI